MIAGDTNLRIPLNRYLVLSIANIEFHEILSFAALHVFIAGIRKYLKGDRMIIMSNRFSFIIHRLQRTDDHGRLLVGQNCDKDDIDVGVQKGPMNFSM